MESKRFEIAASDPTASTGPSGAHVLVINNLINLALRVAFGELRFISLCSYLTFSTNKQTNKVSKRREIG